MTKSEVSISSSKRQAKVRGLVVFLTAAAVAEAGWSCAAPISTMRSPYHLRVVEVRNLGTTYQTLTIEPSADQHLGAATTFTGVLRPGEVKVLYLYHGFEYVFRILDAPGHREVTRTAIEVDRDTGLAFSNGTLVPDARLVVDIGEPTTFADSLQKYDPFGLRSGRVITPDSTRGTERPDQEERGRRRGAVP